MPDLLFSEPSRILADIEAQPPLMRDECARNYLDQPVDWVLIFRNASKNDRNQARLIFTTEPYGMQMVTGAVDLDCYPSLKFLPADTTVRVQGRIRKIDTSRIDLVIDGLTLPKPVEAAR